MALRHVPPPYSQSELNVLLDKLNGFQGSGTFILPYSYVLSKDSTYYYASDAYQVVYGGPSNAGGVDGTDGSAVFQAAVDATKVAGGGTIVLKTGNYIADIVMKSKVNLIGEGRRTTAIYGTITFATTAADCPNYLYRCRIEHLFVYASAAYEDYAITLPANTEPNAYVSGIDLNDLRLMGLVAGLYLNGDDMFDCYFTNLDFAYCTDKCILLNGYLDQGELNHVWLGQAKYGFYMTADDEEGSGIPGGRMISTKFRAVDTDALTKQALRFTTLYGVLFEACHWGDLGFITLDPAIEFLDGTYTLGLLGSPLKSGSCTIRDTTIYLSGTPPKNKLHIGNYSNMVFDHITGFGNIVIDADADCTRFENMTMFNGNNLEAYFTFTDSSPTTIYKDLNQITPYALLTVPFTSCVTDRSGYGLTGTLTGTPNYVAGPTARCLTALECDGSTNVVSYGDTAQIGTGDFTVSFWMKAVSPPTGTDIQGIINKRDNNGASQVGFRIYIIGGSGAIQFFLCDGSASTLYGYGASTTYTDGNWHHVAISFNRDGDAKAYIDGVDDGWTDISSQQLTISNSRNLLVGAEYNNTTSENYFNGDLAAVAIFNRALNEQDIKTLYASSYPTS